MACTQADHRNLHVLLQPLHYLKCMKVMSPHLAYVWNKRIEKEDGMCFSSGKAVDNRIHFRIKMSYFLWFPVGILWPPPVQMEGCSQHPHLDSTSRIMDPNVIGAEHY